MSELTVGIRDLKARLSEYMRQVKNGKTILVTEHGQPVGRILPIEPSLQKRIETLREAGLIAWDGKKLLPIQPPAINRGERLVSDILVEMRE
jgi:prevent-host-death family protein